MKNAMLKKTLSAITLAALGLAANAAQADGWGEHERGYPRPEYRDAAPVFAAPAPQPGFGMHEGWRFAREVNARRDRQMEQILDGIENNRLTREECIALLREQKSIRELQRSFMSDRFMTPGEFQRLMQALDEAERNIRVALSNPDYRRYARPWFWGR